MMTKIVPRFRLLAFFLSFWTGVLIPAQVTHYRQVSPGVSAIEVEQQHLIVQVLRENFLNTIFYRDVLNFYNIGRENPVPSLIHASYADLLRKFETISTQHSQEAVNAAHAIERAIMYLYDNKIYIVGSYNPVQSIFVTGIRKSWLKPWTYFSGDDWTSDNDLQAEQLITELNRLANRIERHSYSEFIRLKMTVESYRNWRRNTLAFLTAYLLADMVHRGAKDSTLRYVINKDFGGVVANAVSNTADMTVGAVTLIPKVGWSILKGTAQGLCAPFTSKK